MLISSRYKFSIRKIVFFVSCLVLIVFIIHLDMDKVITSISGSYFKNNIKTFNWNGIYIPCNNNITCDIDKKRNSIIIHKKGTENIFLMAVLSDHKTPTLNTVLNSIQRQEKYISHEYITIDGKHALAVSVKYPDDPLEIVTKEYHIEGVNVFFGYYGDEKNVQLFERLLNKTKLP